MFETTNDEILGEVDAAISDESQIQAEQLFAQALGQLAAHDKVIAVCEISNGTQEDIQAQQDLVEHSALTPYDVVKFSAGVIRQHFAGHTQQYEQSLHY